MNNPLTSLDEIIWKQFEQVTQYAHRNYGWDKYDCKQITDSLSGVAVLGLGIYNILLGYNLDDRFIQSGYIASGVIYSAGGISLHYFSKKVNETCRKREVKKIIQNRATQQPSFTSARPFGIAMGMGLVFNGIDFLISNDFKTRLIGLIMLPGGAYWEFSMASSYFRSQLLTPPSIKRSF